MKQITLPGTEFSCSKFIFGTASLFNIGASEARARLLSAAVDHGFTHFDTAPLYGFGMAERDLAPILRAHPKVSVTTKVGLYPPGGCNQSALMITARKAAGKLLRPLSSPVKSFDLARAQSALEDSLRRLGRDHIELYLLHEPLLGMVDIPAWTQWLEGRKAAGQIGQYGIALPDTMLGSFLSGAPDFAPVIQTLDSLESKEADMLTQAGKPLQITYGYVSSARNSNAAQDGESILRGALARNRTGAVIVSTSRPERLVQYARLADEAI